MALIPIFFFALASLVYMSTSPPPLKCFNLRSIISPMIPINTITQIFVGIKYHFGKIEALKRNSGYLPKHLEVSFCDFITHFSFRYISKLYKNDLCTISDILRRIDSIIL